jgi:FkbM family methyltransferase
MYYSQSGEDKHLNDTIFKNKRNGVYIELGALDGVLYSNTKFFEDQLGWTGILIEPHPEKFKVLMKTRSNNHLFNHLISSNKEPLEYAYFVNHHAAVSGVFSSLSQHHMDEYFMNPHYEGLEKRVTILNPVSLTDIIKFTHLKHIDFLSLDVEGHEKEVLESWDFSIPIDVILIEMLGVQPEKDQACRDILQRNGYIFIEKYNHNEIYKKS